jgi:tRNA A37 threonylcarbamoyladenosine dehydratase
MLFDRNPDLRRLRDEGFDLALSEGNNHLAIRGVPYLSGKEVKMGTLIVELNLSGDILNPPKDHVIYFIGDQPCEIDGSIIAGIVNPSALRDIDKTLTGVRTFSARPPEPYPDYYTKITAYVTILETRAQATQPSANARTFPPYEMKEHESVFKYADTASSRAKITAISGLLEVGKVAIVGVGGTGSYILDLLVKSPIKEIHIFDGDMFASHNAFRSPGAASIEVLRERPTKAAYHKKVYENLRHRIFEHEYALTASNASELDEMEFAFLCMDGGPNKKAIVGRLIDRGVGFIDVGMGLDAECGAIAGLITTTTVTKAKRDHIPNRISFASADEIDEYDGNIQIAELNALNAALAVIKWKKMRGFYATNRNEHFTVYTLSENDLINNDFS